MQSYEDELSTEEVLTEEGTQSHEPLTLGESERKIIWQAKDFSIREFQSMHNDGELVLRPEYQRNFVATPLIASRLIESILMDVPIPVIYLAEEKDGTYSV